MVARGGLMQGCVPIIGERVDLKHFTLHLAPPFALPFAFGFWGVFSDTSGQAVQPHARQDHRCDR